ncbi:MAG TPA: PAS domain S-box protein, partial [Deltaproteobacteria bacterium]|nr:PAS domain S-box protein [Deltaproteobacteria bacterium]
MTRQGSAGSGKRQVRLPHQAEVQLDIFKRFVETSGQALGMADLDGRVFFVNSTLCRMLGRDDPEQVYRHVSYDFYSPETVQRLKQEIIPQVRQDGQWSGELNLIDVQGRATPTIENIFLIRDDKGEPLCFATVVTDISERIRLEKELETYRDRLERLVAERTSALEETNARLMEEIVERRRAEKGHSRLMEILDSTSDLVGAAFPDGQGMYMNAAGRRMAGFGADEDLSKRNMSEVHPAWAWPYVEQGIQTAIRQGVWEGETVIVNHVTGKEIPVSQVIMAHRAANGEIDLISTIIRDISERKRMEEALRVSEEKFRSIVDNMQDAFFRCDLNGELIYTTASAAHLLGYASAEEMVGLKVRDFYLHPEEAEKHLEMLRSQGRLTHYEVTLKRSNGQPVVVSANSQFYRDKDGTIVGIEGVYSDITDRKQAEEALRKSEERYRRILDTANEGMWMLDADLRTTLVNVRSAEMIGYRVEELIGRKFESFMFEEDLEDHEKRMEARRRGISERYERRLRHRDGHAVITLISATPIFDDELRFEGSFAMITDITERRALEEELIKAQRLDSIGTLAGGLAHDYNNLLTAIMGNMELANLHIAQDSQAQEFLAKARDAALTARDLTRQLITFSQGGYPQGTVMPIGELLKESARLGLSGSHIKTAWRIADDLPEVKIDANQIRQAIYNIVINAQEAMPDGGTLFIAADKTLLGPDNPMRLPQGTYVRLEFRDEGRGITAENLPKVFDL